MRGTWIAIYNLLYCYFHGPRTSCKRKLKHCQVLLFFKIGQVYPIRRFLSDLKSLFVNFGVWVVNWSEQHALYLIFYCMNMAKSEQSMMLIQQCNVLLKVLEGETKIE